MNTLNLLFIMFLHKHSILFVRIRKQACARVYGIELTYATLLLIYTGSKQRNTFAFVEYITYTKCN
jgi:hypothetical protein